MILTTPIHSVCESDKESETVEAFCIAAADSPELAVDTETTVGGDVRDGRDFCMGISAAFEFPGLGLVSNYFPFRHKNGPNLHKTSLAQLKELLEYHDKLIFHNAKFDLVSLQTIGINYTGRFYDTMLMAHMVNENEPLQGKGLDSLTKYYLNDPGKRKSDEFTGFIKAFGWNMVPSYLMHEYGSYDSELTFRLFRYLQDEWDAQDLDKLWPVEEAFTRLLIRMEGRGVRINQALVEGELDRGKSRMGRITDEIGLNPSSPKDLEKLLIDELKLPVVKETPGGKVSFDKYAMVEYEALLAAMDDDRASKILEYRGYQTTIGLCYKPYRELLSPDGRLRPNYKVHGTVTGRLSCEKPNLQQIPRVSEKPWNGTLKQAFIAEPGFTLWEADYSQLELRLASAYARETELIEIFASGRDVFTEMASEIGMARHDVKTLTYTIQYGGGINRISTVFNVSHSRAADIKDAYYAKYPGFRAMSQKASSLCKRQGFIRLWSGRRRHFERPQEEAHKAFNSVIQGGAAEIVKHTMLRLSESVDGNECRMLLQVHDSIVFEIKNGEETIYLPKIKEIMEAIEPDFGVKFAVSIKKWGE
jgi:DNA polymerase I